MTLKRFFDYPFSNRASIPITLFATLFILTLTLYPYNFSFKESFAKSPHPFILGCNRETYLGILQNILLFLPLGFGFTSLLMQVRRLNGLPILGVAILVCFGVSCSIEILQLSLPSRFPSWTDVFSNSVGGLLGCIFLCLWKYKSVQLIWDYTNIYLNLFGCVAVVLLVSLFLQLQTSLCNWDESFRLFLGSNERAGKHPWQGRLSDVYIGDRALSAAEVAHTFSAQSPSAALGESLLAFYRLTGPGKYRDDRGFLSELIWRGRPQDGRHDSGVVLGPHQWLATATPATALSRRLMRISQFTLGATITPHDIQQPSFAHIVSLSSHSARRNFTLGQRGRTLVFRLRTPLTGDYGGAPALPGYEVFTALRPVHVVITYDGAHLLLYVDGVRTAHALELSPGAAAVSYFFRLDRLRLKTYKILYYAVILIPLGLLWSWTVTRSNRRFPLRILIISGGILCFSLMFESLLASVSSRTIALENLFLSLTFMVASSVLFLIWNYHNVHLNVVVYVTVVLLMSISLQLKTSLHTWDETFPLLLGNERTADIPWRGQISYVYFVDRALSRGEVSRADSAQGAPAFLGDSLLAFYRLTGRGKYPDAMGHLPELIWQGESQDRQQDAGVVLDPHQWLSTVTPASALTRRLRQTSQFTMGLTVATHDTNQTGPARIVSLSVDPYRRNFVLGQEGRDLVFRLRTPLTGNNGFEPELRVSEVFATIEKPMNLVLTYNGAHLLVYINGLRTGRGLELTPGAAAVGYFFARDPARMWSYKVLYYAIAFIPLSLLWLRSGTMLSRRAPLQILIISGGILLASMIHEGLLVRVSGRHIMLENLLLSLILMVVPLALMKFFRYLSLARKR